MGSVKAMPHFVASLEQGLPMVTRRLAGSCLLALAALLSGCFATQSDILDIETQNDELKSEVQAVKKELSSIQANQADLAVQIKQLNETLSAFNETVKESQSSMGRLSSKLDDLSASVANKVASIGSSLTVQQAKSLEEQKASLARQEAALQRQSSPTELFNAADVRLSLKSYALAAKGFEEYLDKFPKAALADVATYKLGQVYYGQKKWVAAGQQFALALEKYPKSGFTASARLLYALCLINMSKNFPEARQYLESIAADFPSSPEARVAASHLKKLSARPAHK
jgi:TolA-binding protein